VKGKRQEGRGQEREVDRAGQEGRDGKGRERREWHQRIGKHFIQVS